MRAGDNGLPRKSWYNSKEHRKELKRRLWELNGEKYYG